MEQERLWTLLGKKLAGIATDEELQELDLLLLAYGEEAGSIEIIERMWSSRKKKETAGNEDTDRNTDAVRDKIENALGLFASPRQNLTLVSLSEKKKRPLLPWLLTAVTACVLGLVLVRVYRTTGEIDKKETMNVLFTRNRSHSNLQLPDGTLVVLNENSRLSYNNDFGNSRREIFLEGEAYFDVAKNAGTPLVIHARNVDITVLGTTLNVKAYPEDRNVETSLFKGAVEVRSKRFPQQKVVLRPNEKIAIQATMKDTLDETFPVQDPNSANLTDEADSNAGSTPAARSAAGHTVPINLNNHPPAGEPAADTLSYQLQTLKPERSSRLIPEMAWIYRKLVFNQEPFGSVAEKLEKWYDVNIYFEDDDLKKEVFTGSFGKETLEEALKALQYTYHHFSFIIKKKEIFIKRIDE